jgi:hypothetical protein
MACKLRHERVRWQRVLAHYAVRVEGEDIEVEL